MPNAKDRNIDFSKSFVIIPVHNRRETTLKCLSQLKSQGDLEAFQVVVVDDGSTDGTGEVIQKDYPQVHLLTGDGNLWWTGSVEMGMRYAFSKGADYFIWLNDDTLPEQDAISNLVKECNENQPCAIAAQCYNTGRPTYGGHVIRASGLYPITPSQNQTISVDTLCGNLTCIPRGAIEVSGFPSSCKTPHYHGDTLYTWKLKTHGFQILVTDKSRGICESNPGDPSWLNSNTPAVEIWKKIQTPKSPFYASGFFQFCIGIWGLPGILVFVQPYLRLICISTLKLLGLKKTFLFFEKEE